MKKYNKIITIIIIIAIFLYAGPTLIGRAFGLRAFVFKTDDMTPTIKNGDKVVLYKKAYRHRLPSADEIIALVLPDNPEKIYIRRITQKTNDNRYLVSADNKEGADSRKWGYIHKSNIVGEVVLVYAGGRCTYNKLLKK